MLFPFLTALCASLVVLSDAFSSGYRCVTRSKTFDRAVSRYRRGQDQTIRNETGKEGGANSRRLSQLIPALKANLARIPSSQAVQPDCASTSSLTLAEVEACLRSRLELLPEMMLNEVLRLRDHTRYFLIANGHADALSPQAESMGKKEVLELSRENAIPEEMKELLDDIAQEEGLEGRLKREVWDDVHARNVSLVLFHIALSRVPHCDVVRRCLCLVLRVSIPRHESLYSPAGLR
jgi:hypothetical protein